MTEQKHKPGLDEQTFSKLLEAAYVLQEHNLKKSPSELSEEKEARAQGSEFRQQPGNNGSQAKSDYTLTLSEILEVQHQIQVRHLEADEAMLLVAERTASITHASGAALGILDGETIQYRAAAGVSALPVGSEVPVEDAICARSVRTGKILRTPDISKEPLFFDLESCRKRRIQSVVTVPIYHDGDIVGALELYFDKLQGFTEQDIHTCQLMGGLMTEAIARSAEIALKKSMDAERTSMLAAIEMLKPNLVAMAKDFNSATGVHEDTDVQSGEAGSTCWKCQEKLLEQEQFCGNCGAPRVGDSQPSTVQSKVASALRMQQASHPEPPAPLDKTVPVEEVTLPATAAVATASKEDRDHIATLFPPRTLPEGSRTPWQTSEAYEHSEAVEHEEPSAQAASKGEALVGDAIQSTEPEAEVHPAALLVSENDVSNSPPLENEDAIPSASGRTLEEENPDAPWTSPEKSREFVEGLPDTPPPNAFVRFWSARRGDFYLAIAIILVLAVIRWGIFSSGPAVPTAAGNAASAGANRRKFDADLSLFDKFLINLGLAEPPEAPEYKGNPDTQVWIDPHTALYYCPDSELYGKTSKGKFVTQRNAQLDQFEPASRKACD